MSPADIETKTLFKTISEHREVTRTITALTNVIVMHKGELARLLEVSIRKEA